MSNDEIKYLKEALVNQGIENARLKAKLTAAEEGKESAWKMYWHLQELHQAEIAALKTEQPKAKAQKKPAAKKAKKSK